MHGFLDVQPSISREDLTMMNILVASILCYSKFVTVEEKTINVHREISMENCNQSLSIVSNFEKGISFSKKPVRCLNACHVKVAMQ